MKTVLLCLIFVSFTVIAAEPIETSQSAWTLDMISKAPGLKIEKSAGDSDSSGLKLRRLQYLKSSGSAMNRITVEAVGNSQTDIKRVKVAFERYGNSQDAQTEAIAARTIDTLIGKDSGVVQRIKTRWDDKRPGPFQDTINGISVRVMMAGQDSALVYLER